MEGGSGSLAPSAYCQCVQPGEHRGEVLPDGIYQTKITTPPGAKGSVKRELCLIHMVFYYKLYPRNTIKQRHTSFTQSLSASLSWLYKL